MITIVNKELDDKPTEFYKDTMGRGWKVEHLELTKSRCYRAGCKNLANLEMTRVSAGLQRRELMCGKCFQDRSNAWSLKRCR